MQNEITTPVRPRQDPNFRDLRPADQIIANPIEGHDYSYHPHFSNIQNGLAMKRMNAGLPAAGMKLGVQGAAPVQPQTPNVGVANAYAQPGAQKGGYGEITMGGHTDHLYTPPERVAQIHAQVQANSARAERDRQAQARQQAIQHSGVNMEALMNEYYGGRASMDQVANAQASLGQYAGAQLGHDSAYAQAAAHKAANFNPHQDPAFMAAAINQMNMESQARLEAARNNDPMSKLPLIDAINKDPQRRATVLAMQGVDPGVIAALPSAPRGGAVNAANLAQHLEQPQNQELGRLLGNSEMPFDDKLARASQFPDFADRNSVNRQAFDTWLQGEYANRPDEWARQYYVPPKPTGGPIGNFIQTLGARLINAPSRLFGGGVQGGVGGSLFNGQGDYDAARRRVGLLTKYGISPQGPIGVAKESE
jgi:hypothetical protein